MTTAVLRFTCVTCVLSTALLVALGCGGKSGSKPDGSTMTTHHPGGSGPATDDDGGTAGDTPSKPAGSAGSAGSDQAGSGNNTPSGAAGSGSPMMAGAGGAIAAGSGAVGDMSMTGGGAGSGGSSSAFTFVAAADSTYLSDTDISPNGVSLSADHLSGEWLGPGTWGVRSTRSIAPKQGVFYFEATLAPGVDYFDLGIATAAADLGRPAGATAEGFSVNNQGYFAVNNNISTFTPAGSTYGFVVDYRGAHPIAHVIGGQPDPAMFITSQTLDAISAPVFVMFSGGRRIPGPEVTLNAGNDTANRPFAFDPVAVLNANSLGDTASALVLGWGATHKSKVNSAPTLTITPPSSTTIALGDSVSLSATANDAEDGSLTANIAWDVLSDGNGVERVHGSGGTFMYKPNTIGHHPIQASVIDSSDKQTQLPPVVINVTGTLQQYSDVRLTLEPDVSGAGITVAPNGLQTHWTVDQKNGVRANQGLYNGFWYVEGHRLTPMAENQAIGLVIGGVSLNPYHFDVTPPSCSVNTVGPSVWQDLIDVGTPEQMMDITYYGLAVDYRVDSSRDYPIVYVIINGAVVNTLALKDVTVPIYPMLYGNVNTSAVPWDMEINFGATAFHEDPAMALSKANIPSTGLQLCWGTMNNACLHH